MTSIQPAHPDDSSGSPWPPAVALPLPRHKGRGAALRVPSRFESQSREPFDDGWDGLSGQVAAQDRPPVTELRWEDARSALSYNRSPDVGFDRSLNPYRGCEHGCSYCYARPSHGYLGLSPGLDFETVLIARRGLDAALRRELLAPGYRPAPVALGTVTDAYQPLERRLRLTRALLEVLHAARHPLTVVTKGSGIERDLDLLAPMAAQGLVAVDITITTLDADLARRLEPRAAAPHRRLRTIAALAQAGVPVGVSVAPQIPFVNEDLEQVLVAAREAGATRAFYTVLRLPWELAPLFRQWLAQHLPERAERVMARVHDLRGGRDYDADWAQRMKGQGLWADLLRQRFERARSRLGYTRGPVPLETGRFRPAALAGQTDLFGDRT